MKRWLIGLIFVTLCSSAFAEDLYSSRDLTRQMTSGWIADNKTNYVLKSSPGRIHTVSVLATTAGGYIEIFDATSAPSASTPQTIDGTKLLVELYDGTVSDTKFAVYVPYLQATKGIVITTVNAEAIVTYY